MFISAGQTPRQPRLAPTAQNSEPNAIYFTIVLLEPNALASGVYQRGPNSEATEAGLGGAAFSILPDLDRTERRGSPFHAITDMRNLPKRLGQGVAEEFSAIHLSFNGSL